MQHDPHIIAHDYGYGRLGLLFMARGKPWYGKGSCRVGSGLGFSFGGSLGPSAAALAAEQECKSLATRRQRPTSGEQYSTECL